MDSRRQEAAANIEPAGMTPVAACSRGVEAAASMGPEGMTPLTACSRDVETAADARPDETTPITLLPRRPIPYSQGMDSQHMMCRPGKKADESAILLDAKHALAKPGSLNPMRLQKDTLGYIGVHRDICMPIQPRMECWDEECSPPETLSSYCGPERRPHMSSCTSTDNVTAQGHPKEVGKNMAQIEAKALATVNETLHFEVL